MSKFQSATRKGYNIETGREAFKLEFRKQLQAKLIMQIMLKRNQFQSYDSRNFCPITKLLNLRNMRTGFRASPLRMLSQVAFSNKLR
jgi:hypothetical protein